PHCCSPAAHVGSAPLFSVMPRPLSRSTIFPYTTLFRSSDRASRNRHDRRAAVPPRARVGQRRDAAPGPAARPSGARRVLGLLPADRKSTRLNSSHVSTSYAAFCLKKKIIPGSLTLRLFV